MVKIPDDVPLIHGLRNHPEEARLVGLMLMGYSEIEFRMFTLFNHFIGDDDRALKMFFRNRSEGVRIDLYDAACRPEMKALGLEGQFSSTLGGIKYCHKIRNRYAHSTWSGEKPLLLINYGENSKKAEPTGGVVKGQYVNLALLQEQYMYFARAMIWAGHLTKLAKHHPDKPSEKTPSPIGAQPPLHIQPGPVVRRLGPVTKGKPPPE